MMRVCLVTEFLPVNQAVDIGNQLPRVADEVRGIVAIYCLRGAGSRHHERQFHGSSGQTPRGPPSNPTIFSSRVVGSTNLRRKDEAIVEPPRKGQASVSICLVTALGTGDGSDVCMGNCGISRAAR